MLKIFKSSNQVVGHSMRGEVDSPRPNSQLTASKATSSGISHRLFGPKNLKTENTLAARKPSVSPPPSEGRLLSTPRPTANKKSSRKMFGPKDLKNSVNNNIIKDKNDIESYRKIIKNTVNIDEWGAKEYDGKIEIFNFDFKASFSASRAAFEAANPSMKKYQFELNKLKSEAAELKQKENMLGSEIAKLRGSDKPADLKKTKELAGEKDRVSKQLKSKNGEIIKKEARIYDREAPLRAQDAPKRQQQELLKKLIANIRTIETEKHPFERDLSPAVGEGHPYFVPAVPLKANKRPDLELCTSTEILSTEVTLNRTYDHGIKRYTEYLKTHPEDKNATQLLVHLKTLKSFSDKLLKDFMTIFPADTDEKRTALAEALSKLNDDEFIAACVGMNNIRILEDKNPLSIENTSSANSTVSILPTQRIVRYKLLAAEVYRIHEKNCRETNAPQNSAYAKLENTMREIAQKVQDATNKM
ncbi:hypothetical protein [Rugamonas aquatica]|uniref:Uncharacterized protein n=1 Tax=Rugamonas aquatica TaxID=2743357 RepID=A0A6A7N6J9_9BURK|nr:hypothetical protein [Rugamonas aquatica]MQA40713.1 hypothetical protein [Rugamonas aquatica]